MTKILPRAVAALVCALLVAAVLVPAQAASPAPQDDRVRIAVLNFENNSTWRYWGDHLGDAAADELVTQLVQSDRFQVIERAQIESILEEQNFGMTGRVDASTAAEVGRILGVQAILTGSITQFSIERVSGGIGPLRASYAEAESKLDVRIVDVNTAEIITVAEGEGDKRIAGGAYKDVNIEREFDAGLAQEALRPAVESVVRGVVAEADRIAAIQPPVPAAQVVGTSEGQVYIDHGENYGVEVGQRFEVFAVVDEIRDAEGNLLDQVTDKVGEIEVIRVLSQSAVCRIVDGTASEGDTVRAAG